LTTYTNISHPLFLPSEAWRLALESTQLPLQWSADVASAPEEQPGVKLNTQLCLVERLKMCGTVTSIHHMPSW